MNLTERLVLEGFSYKKAFPFSGVAGRSWEKILEELKRVLNTETLITASKILNRKGYDCCLKAAEVSEKRFLFYKNLLESEELRNKYLTKLGAEDITLRIVFAMYGCITHANKILCHMDNLIEDLVPDSILAMEIGYDSWEIGSINEPITKCAMTGVCICEKGDNEPYIDGCVISDPTIILISKAEQQKRTEDIHTFFLNKICGDK